MYSFGDNRLDNEYEEYLNRIISAENFLAETYPPMIQSHLVAYGDASNKHLSALSSNLRECALLRNEYFRELKILEKNLLENMDQGETQKVSVYLEPEFQDQERTIEYLDILLQRSSEMVWQLKQTKEFYLKLIDKYMD